MEVLGLDHIPHPSAAEANEDLVLAIEHGSGPERERVGHAATRIALCGFEVEVWLPGVKAALEEYQGSWYRSYQ